MVMKIRRRVFRKRGKGTYAMAKKALFLAKRINKEIERKVTNNRVVEVDIESLADQGYKRDLMDLTLGDDYGSRQGNVVTVTALSCEFKFTSSANLDCNNTGIKWAIVLDKEPQGNAPDSGLTQKVWQYNSSTDVGVCSLYNMDNNLGRYKIIRSGIISLNSMCYVFDGAELHPRVSKYLQIYHKFKKPMKVTYDSGDSYPVTNRLYFVCFADNQCPSPPTVTGMWRIHYIDA